METEKCQGCDLPSGTHRFGCSVKGSQQLQVFARAAILRETPAPIEHRIRECLIRLYTDERDKLAELRQALYRLQDTHDLECSCPDYADSSYRKCTACGLAEILNQEAK